MAFAAPHRHCRVCGKVTAPEQETCGKACRARREEQVRSSANTRRLFYFLMAVVIGLSLLTYLR